MKTLVNILAIIVLTVLLNISGVFAQYNPRSEIVEPVNLNGPRIGVTLIQEGEVTERLEEQFDVNPVFVQFGWQFETRFFELDNGTAGLVEVVVLAGAIEQQMLLPSGSFLIGLRNSSGVEFGFGPNISLSGIGFVFAVGVTAQSQNINFPINLAIAPDPNGFRVSLLTGFNARFK